MSKPARRAEITAPELTAPLCWTCGTQFPPGDAPARCPICEDERQYIGHEGQRWTSIGGLEEGGYKNEIREQEAGVSGIGTIPSFAIGQRAILIRTDAGNVLWDSTSLVDEQTVAAVEALGGLDAIAVSHPHYHASMVTWSKAFKDVPVYLHELVRPWVMRQHGSVRFWSGRSLPLFGGLTLYNTGGHFKGFQVLHWPDGAEGRGVLFSGDQPFVAADRRWVSFMYSYPNYIPLGEAQIRRIVEVLEPLDFDRIYGAWWDRIVVGGGKEALLRSALRYSRAITGSHD